MYLRQNHETRIRFLQPSIITLQVSFVLEEIDLKVNDNIQDLVEEKVFLYVLLASENKKNLP